MSKPTTPAGLASSSITSSAVTLSWQPSRNVGVSLQTGPTTGAWFGLDCPIGDAQHLLACESLISRKVDVYRADYRMTGSTSFSFPTVNDLAMYSGGRVSTGQVTTGGRVGVWSLTTLVGASQNPARYGLLANITPAGSSAAFGGTGSNNVWTYTQISSGVLDAYWSAEFTRVAAWGMPAWFVFEPLVDGNGRATNAGGGGGTNAHLAAAGTFSQYVAAWAHLRELATAAGASNLVWVVSYGQGEKDLSVYQAAYPGDDTVDWISWWPSNTQPQLGDTWRSTADTLDLNGILTVKSPSISAGSATKPLMLGDYGCGYDPTNVARRPSWIDALVTAASATNLKTLIYREAPTSDLDVQVWLGQSWSNTGTVDAASWASMKQQAADSYFKQQHDEGGTGIGGYNVYVDGSETPAGRTVGTGTTIDLDGYAPASTHTFRISALDTTPIPEESELSTPISVTFATVEPVAPGTPSDLVATVVSDRQINLSWDLPADRGSGIGGYRVFVDGSIVATVTPGSVTEYAVANLEASTSYSFFISAGDSTLAAWSDPTGLVAAQTRNALDSTPPDTPPDLRAAVVGDPNSNNVSIVLMWSPSDGTDGTVGYNVYRDDVRVGQIGRGDGRYKDTGLRVATSYDYELTAFDWAKNESSPVALTVRTSAASTTAPLAVLTVTPASGLVPLTVTADASPSIDPAGRPLIYSFDFGDVPAADGTRFNSATNIYVTPGEYLVSVAVTNDIGYSDTVSVRVSAVAAESRTNELNLYLPKPGDHLVGPDAKTFWDQIRAGLRALDTAVKDLRSS